MGIVACRGYVGSQLRSAPPCSNPFCTGRGCRFVNVFSYNGFLLPHVRRRHDFLSRFKPYTSFDRNQPSSFLLCLASETWHGFPRDPPSLLLRPCVFLPPGTIQLSKFWRFLEGGRREALALSLILRSSSSSSFFLWVTLLLLLFALLSILEIFSLLGFHAFPSLFAYSIPPKFLLSSLTRTFCTPLSAKFNRTSLRDAKALHPLLQEVFSYFIVIISGI